MFEPNSRYETIDTARYRDNSGRELAYVRRRFVPRGENMLVLTEVEIAEGERLDLITARTLGDSEQYWRVCDANNSMNPMELTTEIGRRLRVPIPQFEDIVL
ncbi:MAG: hypothetical protein MJE77_20335 [Proteobacteria bacterium]|nr:hypothetical protein [Pseudomonadota bacterium]